MSRVVRLVEIAQDMTETDIEFEQQKPERAGEHLRMVEALLFAASEPLEEKALTATLPEGADLKAILSELQAIYEGRGVTLVNVAGKWQFRTAPDLAFLLRREKPEQRRLSRAAIETLAIIAYHQPVTRAEIEEIRGVIISKGTLDLRLEIGWIKPHGRRETPGRPVTWATTSAFLEHFGLEGTEALPGVEELRAAGLLDSRAAISTLATQASAAGHAVPEDEDEQAAAEELRGEAEPSEESDEGAPVEMGGEDDTPSDDDYESELLERHGEGEAADAGEADDDDESDDEDDDDSDGDGSERKMVADRAESD